MSKGSVLSHWVAFYQKNYKSKKIIFSGLQSDVFLKLESWKIARKKSIVFFGFPEFIDFFATVWWLCFLSVNEPTEDTFIVFFVFFFRKKCWSFIAPCLIFWFLISVYVQFKFHCWKKDQLHLPTNEAKMAQNTCFF